MPGVEDAVRAAVNEENGNESKENQNGESAGTENQVEKSAGTAREEQNEVAEEVSKEKAPAKAEEKDKYQKAEEGIDDALERFRNGDIGEKEAMDQVDSMEASIEGIVEEGKEDAKAHAFDKWRGARKEIQDTAGKEEAESTKGDKKAKGMLTARTYNKVYKPTVAILRKAKGTASKAAEESALLYSKMVEGIGKRFNRPVEEVAAKIQLGGEMKPGDFGMRFTPRMGEKAWEKLKNEKARWSTIVKSYLKAEDKDKWINDRRKVPLYFMDVPAVLKLVLGENVDTPHVLYVDSNFIKHALRKDHPGMYPEMVKQLPYALTDPIMIVEGNKNNPGSYVFIVELKTKGGTPVVVPISINKEKYIPQQTNGNIGKRVLPIKLKRNKKGKIYKDSDGNIYEARIFDLASSEYGRTLNKTTDVPQWGWFQRQLDKRKVVYLNREKSMDLPAAVGMVLPQNGVNPTVAPKGHALSQTTISNVRKAVKAIENQVLNAINNP